MTSQMLEEILRHKKRRLEELDVRSQIRKMETAVSNMSRVTDLKKRLCDDNDVGIIAEIKRRSPSKGVLAAGLDAAKTARIYERAGAKAISVLTENRHFGGSIDDLKTVKNCTNLPVLRKDFIIHDFQVWETRFIGADAVLLIAAVLKPDELRRLHTLAREIGLEVLLEVHTEDELEKALAVDPKIVGINNRNLRTFEVDLSVAERLAPLIPTGMMRVAESGIKERRDVLRLQKVGIDAVLVGEEIVRSADPYASIRRLRGQAP